MLHAVHRHTSLDSERQQQARCSLMKHNRRSRGPCPLGAGPCMPMLHHATCWSTARIQLASLAAQMGSLTSITCKRLPPVGPPHGQAPAQVHALYLSQMSCHAEQQGQGPRLLQSVAPGLLPCILAVCPVTCISMSAFCRAPAAMLSESCACGGAHCLVAQSGKTFFQARLSVFCPSQVQLRPAFSSARVA